MDFSNRNAPQKVSDALPRGFFLYRKYYYAFFYIQNSVYGYIMIMGNQQ